MTTKKQATAEEKDEGKVSRRSIIKSNIDVGKDGDTSISSSTIEVEDEFAIVKNADNDARKAKLFYRQGRYFSIALIAVASISLANGFGHFIAFCLTRDWSRNFASTVLGYASAKEDESEEARRGLDIHALVGVAILIPVLAQALNAYYLHHSDKPRRENSSALFRHRFNGWVIVVVWVFMGITGLVFSFVSQKYDEIFDGKLWSWQRVVHMAVNLWSTFLFMIVNLYFGIRAAMSLRRGAKSRSQGLVLHKGTMFFAIFWPLRCGLDQCILAVHQIILHNEFVGEGEHFIYATAIVCTVWFVALFGFAWFYEKTLLSYSFVRLNFIGLAFKTAGNWGIALYVVKSAYFE